MAKFNELLGQTLKSFVVDRTGPDDQILIETDEGKTYRMMHEKDCCESVYIEDICGDPENLVGVPIMLAEEVNNHKLPPKPNSDTSHTWTFYKLATILGNITIRWYGTSNGYYSESVDFIRKNANGEFDRWGEDSGTLDTPGY